jgi:hypothetical protein
MCGFCCKLVCLTKPVKMTDKDKYQNILACLFTIMYFDIGPLLILLKLLSNFLQTLFVQGVHYWQRDKVY